MPVNKDKIAKLFSLHGKIAVVTGGDGMLGLEYQKILKLAGAKVYSFDIKSGVDITNVKILKKAVRKIIQKHKKIDILINNAGLNPPPDDTENYKPYEKFELKRWQEEINIGLTGALICTQAIVPSMKKQKSGVIINISSDLGLIAPDNRIYDKGKFKSLAYPTVKGAILQFTRTWASYLAPHGIRVNTLVPGGVYTGQDKKFVERNTRLNMMGRMAQKNEYNAAILFLCSNASSYMTASTLVIDGGRTAW